MYDKIKKYIKDNNLLKDCGHVVIGLSGGADSVCLALVLKEYAKETGFDMTLVHIHHGIRGKEADEDAAFCRQFAMKEEMPYVERHFDVLSYAAEHGLSSEEAGRILRYKVFNDIAAVRDNARIAVAHHMNDQAETVIFNMCRGSGIGGMKGMLAMNGNVIRPLLCCERAEIEAYLKSRDIGYCVDSTNNTDDYSRNIIRNKIVPLCREINEAAVKNIASAAQMFKEAEGYLKKQADEAYERNVTKTDKGYVFHNVKEVDSYIAGMVIRMILGSIAGGLKDITSKHVKDIYSLGCGGSGHSIDIRKDLIITGNQDGLFFSNQQILDEAAKGRREMTIDMEVIPWDNSEKISNDSCTKYFDYDKIKSKPCVRTRQDGDYLTIDDAGHCKKLNQYFIDNKIPQRDRDDILLLADNSHIMWVVGYRISSAYKVNEHTTQVLKAHYGGKHNGES